MKQLFFLMIFACLSTSLIAQKKGDISEDILAQEYHPSDSSASAAYILDEVSIRYEFNASSKILMYLDYHSIIKIYKEDGEEYGNKEIYLYGRGGKDETVSKIKAVTSNLVDGKIVKTKLDKKDIYEEKVSDYYKKKIFALPEVKEGSVIDIKYTLTTPYLYTIPQWYFQDYIPTDLSSYTIKVPQYFILTPIPSGFHTLETSKEEIKVSNHGEVKYTYLARDVPAIKEDDYVLNENDYRSGIKYEIKSTRFPGQTREDYSKDWNEIAAQLRKSDRFGKQLKKNLKEVEPIITEAKKLEQKERISYLYNYVRENYAWNKKYSVGSSDGLKKLTENKSGNSGEINLLLQYLLKKCGVVSYPLVMKARYSGLLNTYFPTLTELDYTLVYIEIDDSYLLLDASSRLTPMGELPPRAINYTGILVRENSAEELNLTNPNTYKIQTVSKYEYDVENNTLVGTSQRKRSGYAATKYRQDQEEKDIDEEEDDTEEEGDDGQDDDIESFDLENTYEITNIKNLDDIYSPINLDYNEQLVTCSKKIGDKIFIDAALDFGLKENPFTDEFRDYPIFYKNTINSRTVAAIKIPEGYMLESKPEPIKAALPDRAGTFSYSVNAQANEIIINYYFTIKDTLVLPANYPALKKLYQMVYEISREKIVLAKI